MDGVALAHVSQLRAFTSSIARDAIPQLSSTRVAEICTALVSQRLLGEAQLQACSQAKRNEAVQAVDAWFTTLVNALQHADQVSHRTHLTRLLAASASVTDLPRLLLTYEQWLTILLDQLKQQKDALLQQLDSQQPAVAVGQQLGQRKKLTASVSSGALGGSGASGLVSSEGVRMTCDAVGHIFTRLGDVMEVGGVRREASALASRACGLALPLASLQTHPICLAAPSALQLIHILISTAPASLRNHASALETTLTGAVVAGGGSGALPGIAAAIRRTAAAAVAALPRVAGDAATYSDMYRRLLLSLHDVLDVIMMGLEDPAVAGGPARTALNATTGAAGTSAGQQQSGTIAAAVNGVPQASSGPLLPLALVLGEVEGTSSRHRVSAGMVQTLADVALAGIDAAQRMLVGAYPTPVALPSAALLHLASRVLRFNDAQVLLAQRVPLSTGGFLQLQAALPSLYTASAKLLQLVVMAAGPAMLPLHAALSRLLAEQLRRLRVLGPGAAAATPAAARVALYCLAAAACKASGGGVAVAKGIAADVLGAVTVELYGWTNDGAGAGTGVVGAGVGALLSGGPSSGQPATKKARLTEAAEAVAGAAAAAAAAVAASGPAGCFAMGSSGAAAAIAALQLLGAVVAAAGPLLPAVTRATADSLAYHMAATAGEAAVLAGHEPGVVTGLHAAGLGVLRAQALRTLLVTLVTPLDTRPPYLSQAVLLFREASSSRCGPVSDAVRSGMMALEALLHPRATPITGIRHMYAGMSEVVPLSWPKLWSSLQAAPQIAAHVPPAATPAVVHAAPVALLPAWASAGPQAAVVTAVHAAVQSRPEAAISKIAAAASKASATPAPKAVLAMNGAAAGKPQAHVSKLESANRRDISVAGAADPAPPAVLQQGISPQVDDRHIHETAVSNQQSVVSSGDAGKAAPDAAASAPAAVFAAESSDSEGSLPDIDEGNSDGEEASDDEMSED